jgi:hypothetical protein
MYYLVGTLDRLLSSPVISSLCSCPYKAQRNLEEQQAETSWPSRHSPGAATRSWACHLILTGEPDLPKPKKLIFRRTLINTWLRFIL